MNISDFNYPDKHPYDTFGKADIESFMAWFLGQCFAAGDIDAVVTTRMNEDYLVDKGLLIKMGEQQYRLTAKSKGILYSFYGKG